MQALDLILYRHGRPQAVNTSQNIYRMNPVFGHRAPLCVLTWGPKEFIQQLVYEHRKHKSQRSSLFCPKALWPLSDWWFATVFDGHLGCNLWTVCNCHMQYLPFSPWLRSSRSYVSVHLFANVLHTDEAPNFLSLWACQCTVCQVIAVASMFLGGKYFLFACNGSSIMLIDLVMWIPVQ